MPKNNLSDKNITASSISSLINPKTLNALTEKNQKIAIDTVREAYSKEKDGGWLGQFLGTNKINVSIHVVLIISTFILIAGYVISDKAIWDKIFTIIATSIGYIFGNSTEK